MELRTNPEAMGLGVYQSVLALVGLVILVALAWRAYKAVVALRAKGKYLSQKDLIAVGWPPVVWLAVLLGGAIVFTTMQAYGPRVAIPKTDLSVNGPEAGGEVRDLSPQQMSDEERLREQRRLEAETKSRVNLE